MERQVIKARINKLAYLSCKNYLHARRGVAVQITRDGQVSLSRRTHYPEISGAEPLPATIG